MIAGGNFEPRRLLRHDNPRDGIGQQADASQDRRNQPNQAYQGYIQIKVLSESGADPRDSAVGARTYQTLARHGAADSPSAIGTMAGIVLDNFAAIVAVHVNPPQRPSY